jgi:hypothetical protein
VLLCEVDFRGTDRIIFAIAQPALALTFRIPFEKAQLELGVQLVLLFLQPRLLRGALFTHRLQSLFFQLGSIALCGHRPAQPSERHIATL